MKTEELIKALEREMQLGLCCPNEYIVESINKLRRYLAISQEIEDWIRTDEDDCVVLDRINSIIDTVEEENFVITECRKAAIEENLPLYFIYYEETGIFEVYVTKTKELFEKRHCVKHLSDDRFRNLARQYLDDYSEMIYQQYNYCPNCGAYMRGKDDE